MTTAELIKEFCEDYGYEFYGNYSGRFMYGRKCVGIVAGDIYKVLLELADYLRDNEIESASEELGTVATDNMGLDMIVYFPSVEME